MISRDSEQIRAKAKLMTVKTFDESGALGAMTQEYGCDGRIGSQWLYYGLSNGDAHALEVAQVLDDMNRERARKGGK